MPYADPEKRREWLERRRLDPVLREGRRAASTRYARKIGKKPRIYADRTANCADCGVTRGHRRTWTKGRCAKCYASHHRTELGHTPVDRTPDLTATCVDCGVVRGDRKMWAKGRCPRCYMGMRYKTSARHRERVRKYQAYSVPLNGDSMAEKRVYLIVQGDWMAMKVGYSRDPDGRRKMLQTANPYPLRLVANIDGDQATEAFIHGRLDQFRMMGEWFAVTDESMRIVAESFGMPDLEGVR